MAFLFFTGIAFVATVLLKHYVRRFAGWHFGWLLAMNWVLAVFAFVVIAIVWKG